MPISESINVVKWLLGIRIDVLETLLFVKKKKKLRDAILSYVWFLHKRLPRALLIKQDTKMEALLSIVMLPATCLIFLFVF